MVGVRSEVKSAYVDMQNPSNNTDYANRDLQFLASRTVSPNQAKQIMEEATPKGYNNFSPSLIPEIAGNFQDTPEVLIGRSGSVALYFIGELDSDTAESDLLSYCERHRSMRAEDFVRMQDGLERSEAVKTTVRDAGMVHLLWWD